MRNKLLSLLTNYNMLDEYLRENNIEYFVNSGVNVMYYNINQNNKIITVTYNYERGYGWYASHMYVNPNETDFKKMLIKTVNRSLCGDEEFEFIYFPGLSNYELYNIDNEKEV